MQKHIKTSLWVVASIFAVSLGAAAPVFAESAGAYIDDATITTKVKAAFLADSQLKATRVSVETDHGVVQLTGAVDSKDQESQAVNDATKISGVKSVKDLLTVNSTQEQ